MQRHWRPLINYQIRNYKSTSIVKELDIDKVPIIDIGSLRDNSDPTSVATELYEASTGLGFIYIKNHGIPQKKIDALRDDGLKFFRSSEENKAVSYTHLTLPTT